MVAAHYKKDDLLLCGLAVGYFGLPCGHSRRTRHCRSRAGARHSVCELTHGMAGERHGRGMLCVNGPLGFTVSRPHTDGLKRKYFMSSINSLQRTHTLKMYQHSILVRRDVIICYVGTIAVLVQKRRHLIFEQGHRVNEK